MELDDYVQKVIKEGDEGSKFLAARCAPTLRNSQHVRVLEEGMNGIAVLQIPERYNVVVHSIGGEHDVQDMKKYAASAVNRAVYHSIAIGATPIAFADVIDSRDGSLSLLEELADGLVTEANKHGLAIMNGENAILGGRVVSPANVSITMIGLIPKISHISEGTYKKGVVNFAVFDPQGKPVYVNSDGIGTKTEFYERAGKEKVHLALFDSLAMKVDDAVKLGATVKVVSDVVETKGNFPYGRLEAMARHVTAHPQFGFAYILQHEPVGNRIAGYNKRKPAFNVSGSCVSVIDEARLKNPLKPSEGEYLMVIRGKPNPRSNGITAKREAMTLNFGEDWHQTPKGYDFLQYLAEPSIVFYPLFKQLVEQGIATSVYHMSGGAFDGKLARPLAKQGLFVDIANPFAPDNREIALIKLSNTSTENAYRKWPMGNDGFITTINPLFATSLMAQAGLEARTVGVLRKDGDRTGVTLTGFDGKKVYFSGKE